MLTEAQIEIVDDAGNVEDRVRIVGTGEIALATTDRAGSRSAALPRWCRSALSGIIGD